MHESGQNIYARGVKAHLYRMSMSMSCVAAPSRLRAVARASSCFSPRSVASMIDSYVLVSSASSSVERQREQHKKVNRSARRGAWLQRMINSHVLR